MRFWVNDALRSYTCVVVKVSCLVDVQSCLSKNIFRSISLESYLVAKVWSTSCSPKTVKDSDLSAGFA